MTVDVSPERAPWHVPSHTVLERRGLSVLLDPERPNWIATDARGARIAALADGRRSLGEIAQRYGEEQGFDPVKAWFHVDRFLRDAQRRGFAAREPFAPARYAGRARYLEPRLRELWLHVTNACNLACEHCLVSSGPDGDRGMAAERLAALVDEAAGLGVERFYLTGGEPFLRPDLFDLIERITRTHGRELVILTNGLLFQGAVLERLRGLSPERLRLQISLDGATAATNDPVRGAGTFERILTGIRNAVAAGHAPTVSTVVTRANASELAAFPGLVKSLGAASWHLLWIHRKGRWAELNGSFVPAATLLSQLRRAQEVAVEAGVRIDNIASFRDRVDGVPGSRVDLSNGGVESLCVYADGRVYPSAATVQYPLLELGRWDGGNLGALLAESAVSKSLRNLSVADKPVCNECRFRYLCGGGDVEHAYSFSLGRTSRNGHGSFDYMDPYCDLYQGQLTDRLFELAEEGRAAHRVDTGFGAPVVYRAMGDDHLGCAPGGELGEPPPVRTGHSNCVVSVSLDRPRELVREFYGNAAETPQPELCCPVNYDAVDTSHIPKEVIDRFYGCGGPMSVADVKAGETVVDLGSGAGIDVFIAARKVGPTGKAIGVDMTDPMLGVAGQHRAAVAHNLGYDVAEFRKGFLEEVPVDDRSVDLVTSNCVINLSPDKKRVFREMWRVLKDHGRIVISDIVCDRAVPASLRVNAHLWGECISGALSEEEFLAELEKAGFYGLQVLSSTFWREVEGYRFSSLTVRGYKFQKQAGCVYLGHRAVYLGPLAAVTDEEGHFFPRGQAIEICTDTLAKLGAPPYAGAFQVLEPDGTRDTFTAAQGASCAPGCC
ncbi:MAG: methyltransferase domain-containing protein [Vicinamibacteria bacterium]|nr:methyltransferase domain-containing protein [Vicinamibacteria bacterium]